MATLNTQEVSNQIRHLPPFRRISENVLISFTLAFQTKSGTSHHFDGGTFSIAQEAALGNRFREALYSRAYWCAKKHINKGHIRVEPPVEYSERLRSDIPPLRLSEMAQFAQKPHVSPAAQFTGGIDQCNITTIVSAMLPKESVFWGGIEELVCAFEWIGCHIFGICPLPYAALSAITALCETEH